MQETKITIIGAGVVGLSIAYVLSRFHQDIIVLERNDSFGQEISSRNSEVIHAGLYYLPDSFKAQTCIKGRNLLYELCSKYNILYKKTEKLVIACNDEEIKKIEKIYYNSQKCGVKNLKFLDSGDIEELEPQVSAKFGFISPDSGIIDSHSLMNFFYTKAKDNGVTFSFCTEAAALAWRGSHYKITVKEPKGDTFSFQSQAVINAAGLNSDKVAQMAGIDIDKYFYRLNYCKGQYFRIGNPKKFSISHLVYPCATQISLGIHITPDLGGGLRLGPDAKYISEINYQIDEADRGCFYESVKRFLPFLEPEDLVPDTVGIRPKLQKEDEIFKDFIIQHESDKGLPGFVNLIGIESPGLTACLAIAEIVKKVLKNA